MTSKYAVFIGGVPGVGKSSISWSLSHAFGINNILSGDYLREFYRAYVRSGNIINYSVYDAWHYFGKETDENILKGFIRQGAIIKKGIERVILRSARNGEPVLIETLYFIPELYRKMREYIIPMYLYISDKKIHEDRLNSRTLFTHFKSPGERLSRKLREYRIMMRYSLVACEKYGIPTFEMSDFESSIERITEYVESQKGWP